MASEWLRLADIEIFGTAKSAIAFIAFPGPMLRSRPADRSRESDWVSLKASEVRM